MLIIYFCTLISVMASRLSTGQAKRSAFYVHADREGQSYALEFEGLAYYNCPSWFNDKSSSVNTDTSCIPAFEHGEWERKMKCIATATPDHWNLGFINMNDQISSSRQCPPTEITCPIVSVYIDYSEAPDIRDMAINMKQVIAEWYLFTSHSPFSKPSKSWCNPAKNWWEERRCCWSRWKSDCSPCKSL